MVNGNGKRSRFHPVYPTRLHWIAAGFGAVVFLGVIAILVGYGVSEGGTPPVIVVHSAPPMRVAEGYSVVVTVENIGGSTAAEIEIEGRAGNGSAEGTMARARLDYLPPGSSREATLMFTHDPMEGDLRVRVLGYRAP
ncbi:hypothetical protein [Amorphus sp. MBR-141]|jgi:uncharacterized protein (TIGR02588 family)